MQPVQMSSTYLSDISPCIACYQPQGNANVAIVLSWRCTLEKPYVVYKRWHVSGKEQNLRTFASLKEATFCFCALLMIEASKNVDN